MNPGRRFGSLEESGPPLVGTVIAALALLPLTVLALGRATRTVPATASAHHPASDHSASASTSQKPVYAA
jgi:hypothetical protein